SSATRRVPTSKVNAASWYPLLVWVPVVSQAFEPVPIGTSWLMISGWAQLPPLCPGSTRIVLPETARRSNGPLAGAGAPADGFALPEGDKEAESVGLPAPADGSAGLDASELAGVTIRGVAAGALLPHPPSSASRAAASPAAAVARAGAAA